MALSPEDVLNKTFTTTQFRRGYDEREVRTRLGEEINGFVRKPFRRAALLAALAEAADPERD